MVVVKNEYEIRFADETERAVIAADMATVVRQYELPGTAIAQITRTRVGVATVEQDPVTPVNFLVDVSPIAAESAGSIALPSAFTVADGDEVIFQAIPGPGYVFDGWYIGAVKLSSSAIAKLPVNAPVVPGQTVQFLAVFAAITP